MLRALEICGVSATRMEDTVEIIGLGRGPRLQGETIDIGDTGTALRFLLPFVAAGEGRSYWTGTDRMKRRPLRPLLAALETLGAQFRFAEEEGTLPFFLEAQALRGGEVAIETDQSSQFLSGLLLAAPLASQPLHVHTKFGGAVSAPYVEMTRAIQSAFGVDSQEARGEFSARGRYRPGNYQVPGDASAAFWFLCAVALAGGEICIQNLGKDSISATLAGLALGSKLGFTTDWRANELLVRQTPGQPFRLDFSSVPDLAPAAAIVALFLPGESQIQGAPHLRWKESDRIGALVQELERCGARIHATQDGLRIEGGQALHAARVDSHADHRLAAAFSLLQLRVPGIEISDTACIAKSYPAFFQDFRGLFRDNPAP